MEKIVIPSERLAEALIKHLLPAAKRHVARLQSEREQKKTS